MADSVSELGLADRKSKGDVVKAATLMPGPHEQKHIAHLASEQNKPGPGRAELQPELTMQPEPQVQPEPEPESESDIETEEGVPPSMQALPTGVPPQPADATAGPEFPNIGISIEGLEHFAGSHPQITQAQSTSDVCHTVIKPLTVPKGWVDIAVLINPEKGWYSHEYKNEATGLVQKRAPSGTSSYCNQLKSDPSTAHMVAEPTVFFSHAWGFCFLNVLAAMRSFVDAQPPGSAPAFFWFDTFSIDEHATQELPQEWWGTTFRDAVEKIGHTAMMLSPWDAPVPLTRAWCLWELYCTVLAGARFSVLLGPAEREAFECAMVDDFDVVLAAFANIDVREAEAGSPEDQSMILTAAEAVPGGFGRLNAVAIKQLRDWIGIAARDMVRRQVTVNGAANHLWVGDDNDQDDFDVPLGRAGSLKGMSADALKIVSSVSNVLASLGEAQDAMALTDELVAERSLVLGSTHTDTLRAKMNRAGLLHRQGDLRESRALFAVVIDEYTTALGAVHNDTLRAQLNFANLLREQGDLSEARPILEQVVAAYSASVDLGPAHTRTLDAQMALSAVLHDQGDMEVARTLKIAVVEGFTALLGKRNFRTLEAQNNLALLLLECDEATEAQRLLQLVAEGYTSQLGTNHPNSLKAQMNLAVCMHQSAELDAAQQLYESVLVGYSQVLGAKHIDTLTAQMNLATVLTEQGDPEGSRLNRLALAGFNEKLGPSHVRSLDAQYNLGKAVMDDSPEEARKLFEAVVGGRCVALGSDHVDTLSAQMNLGIVLNEIGEVEQALELHEIAFRGFAAKLGAEHTDTLRAEFNLAQLLHVQGEEAESIELRRAGSEKGGELRQRARQLYEHVIASSTRHSGAHDATTLEATLNLAALLHDFPGQAPIAQRLYKEVISGYTECHGAQYHGTLTAIVSLAVLLEQEGQHDVAEKEFKVAADGLAEAPGQLPSWIEAHFDESYPDAFPVLRAAWASKQSVTKNALDDQGEPGAA